MKRHRKLAAGTATVALTVTLLAACGSTATQQTQPEEETVIYQTAEATAPLLYEEGSMPADAADIGMDQVMAIVLKQVPGATEADIYELECEYDDGRLEYEGSLYYGGYEYEFEINAASGVIINWEREMIEHDEWDDEWDD